MTETWAGALWVLGGYLVGSIPSTLLVSRMRGGRDVVRRARRDAGEADAHMLMTAHLGGAWSAVAATADVLKALVFCVVARELGRLPPEWLAGVGVALLVGYGWPPYARAWAGRGLAVSAGVYLALLPIPMAVMGGLILIGAARGDTAVWTTLGLLLVPIVAIVQGQPVAFVAMAAAILLLVMARRLEGLGAVVRGGVPRAKAAWYRLAYDSSGPRHARVVDEDPPPDRER